MFKNIVLIFFVVLSIVTYSQNKYQIDVSKVRTEIMRGHLDLGGRNSTGDSISVNSFYLERNGKPFIPVIGEFHFSRYPHRYWDEQLKKIKAGGVTVVATYVFWNLHEKKEGVFEWSGDLNLRHFAELCARNGLEVLMRIGPFAHGEMRNGGLPDWLYGRPIEVRTNDPEYLQFVNRFYSEIGNQLKGLMFRDAGPVVGIQIENEYQHSAAPWGFGYMDAPRERTVGRRDNKITQDGVGINADGNEFANVGHDHMKTLKNIAKKAGLITPIYTATGWGRATIVEKGSIPVMAGYAFPFWSAANSPSPFYLYKDIQQRPDYSPVSYDVNLYPSLAAELGTGMAVTWARRPRVPGESFLPMMVRTIGSGSNGLGFYMYHGGTTPSEGNFYLSEGWGLNHKSYDYQAPIGEFGQVTPGYYGLKIINNFLKYFGDELAPLYPVIPAGNDTIKAGNLKTLRYVVRSNGEKGYLFMHNYQDHLEVKDIQDVNIDVQTKTGNVRFPVKGKFTLKAGVSAIFPINTSYEGLNVVMATVQPYLYFQNKGKKYHVFVSHDGIQPEILFKGKVNVKGSRIKVAYSGGNTHVQLQSGVANELSIGNQTFLILPFNDAQHVSLIGDQDQFLLMSDALVLTEKGKSAFVTSEDVINILAYPSVKTFEVKNGKSSKLKDKTIPFSAWKVELPAIKPNLQLIQADDRHFVLKAPDMNWSEVNDVFITFDYRGDRAGCMMHGELQTDDLYTSKPWVVGLKRYAEALKSTEMYFYFIPMTKDAPYLSYLDKKVIPDFGSKKEFLEIKQPVIKAERSLDFSIK